MENFTCTLPLRECTWYRIRRVLMMPDQMWAKSTGMQFLSWKKLLNQEGHVRITITLLRTLGVHQEESSTYISYESNLEHSFIKYLASWGSLCFTYRIWFPLGLKWCKTFIKCTVGDWRSLANSCWHKSTVQMTHGSATIKKLDYVTQWIFIRLLSQILVSGWEKLFTERTIDIELKKSFI